ncbi:MAG: PD-(D/E)XK nuclease family protein [Acholeplasmatales bacterium]|nr:PD-(D/E)XK nuclease family protein [Acholeplasmatales bacterium]
MMGKLVNEKIIFSNKLNEVELLRTMSKNGHNTFGVRVLNDVEICSYILVHNGETINGKYIDDKEQSFIYLSILSGKLPDAVNIRNAINSFRDCVITNSLDSMRETLSDNYSLKKNTIISVYEKYIDYKKKNNLYDKYDMILYIINNQLKINDVCVEYFNEFEITKSFKEMLDNVFNNVKEVSISNYLYNKKQSKIDFVRAYGKVNEIESIFNIIKKDNIPVDNCQIVLTNPKDMIELLSSLYKLKIPYTTGIGIPFIETKPAKLLKLLLDLKNKNYGVDAYKALFNSPLFNSSLFKEFFKKNGKLNVSKYNEFIKFAGWLRIGFDNIANINSSLYDINTAEALNILNDDMKLGIVPFVKKYVTDDINKQSVIFKMEELVNAKTMYGLKINDDELLTGLFSSYTNKQISNSGSIHISNIDNAFASLRKYTFIIGLDEDFPGNPKENYLIFDDEYKRTGSDLYISTKLVEKKVERTKKLIKSSENAILSYSYYGLFDLKEKNPSSIIYDLLSESKDYDLVRFLSGEEENHKPFGFTSSVMNENKNIICARINNNEAILNDIDYKIIYDPKNLLNKVYSPSSISSFFESKFSFVLSNFFGIKLDDPDNPYDIIQPNTLGTLIHKLMEGFEKAKKTKKQFMDEALLELNNFFEKKPPIIYASKDKVIQEYENIISNLYDMEDENSKCVEYEKKIEDFPIKDIKFSGTFDRIEKNKNGEYILVDYKTGKSIKHENNDPVSCIQGLIYAYMIEHTTNPIITSKNIKRISKIEFRYPYYKKVISIDYSKENEQEMINKIEEFKQAILKADFICDKEDIGKYDKKYLKLLSLYKEVLS